MPEIAEKLRVLVGELNLSLSNKLLICDAATRLEYLEKQDCRFRCRTEKKAYIAGFNAGSAEYSPDSPPGVHTATEAYKAWKK
jgi:hypothetical protein